MNSWESCSSEVAVPPAWLAPGRAAITLALTRDWPPPPATARLIAHGNLGLDSAAQGPSPTAHSREM